MSDLVTRQARHASIVGLATDLTRLHDMLARAHDPLAAASAAVAVFSRLLGQYAATSRAVSVLRTAGDPRQVVRRTREFIDANFARPITIRELGVAVGLGEFHLLRTFLRATGLPPYQYLISVRVRHARRLLASGVPAATVAQRVGFCDQSHLMRHFKRLVGTTPGVYQQATCSDAAGRTSNAVEA